MASMFPAPSPKLPEFRTLLIQGPYHPSAPIHLCLSHNATHDPGKTLLLAPSRANLVSSLREFNDEWISEHGGDGSTHKLARDVNILYPPSPAHMDFVFSMLHEARPFDREDFVRKTTLDEKPTLVVICEPSSYFLDDPDATVSSYLSLVSHAMACVSSMSQESEQPIPLVVFDSGLEKLRLPIIQPSSLEPDEEAESNQQEEPSEYDVVVKREPVAFLTHRFFQWVGIFAYEEGGDREPFEVVHTFHMVQRRGKHKQEPLNWAWRQRRVPGHRESLRTVFDFVS